MGNSYSVIPNDDNTYDSDISKKIDNIALNYILTQTSLDLLRLTDKEYYDNLIILTANILKSNLNNLELGIINDRVKYGKEIENSDRISVSHVDDLREITINNEKVKEKVLHYISKYYVKILTIYSAIVATTDPKYIYEDENEKVIFSLKDFNDRSKIDPTKHTIKLYQLTNPVGLIQRRLLVLKNKIDNTNGEYVTLNPGEKFCDMNKPDNDEDVMKIDNEIGIQELDALYYDEYDYESKSWSKKSDEMKEKYSKDLDKFYKVFTGNTERPDSIESFKDIELLQYHKLPRCKNQEYFKDLIVKRNDPKVMKYLEKIDEINNMNYRFKQRLLHILKIIFIIEESRDETTGETKSKIIINPEITLEKIIDLQDKVRDIIIQMYIHCEYKFIQALIVYEGIYNDQHGPYVPQPGNINNTNIPPESEIYNEQQSNPNLLNSSIPQTMNVGLGLEMNQQAVNTMAETNQGMTNQPESMTNYTLSEEQPINNESVNISDMQLSNEKQNIPSESNITPVNEFKSSLPTSTENVIQDPIETPEILGVQDSENKLKNSPTTEVETINKPLITPTQMKLNTMPSNKLTFKEGVTNNLQLKQQNNSMTDSIIITPTTNEQVPTEPVAGEQVNAESVPDEQVNTDPVAVEQVNAESLPDEQVNTEPVTDEPVKTEPVTDEPVPTEQSEPSEQQNGNGNNSDAPKQEDQKKSEDKGFFSRIGTMFSMKKPETEPVTL